MKKDIQPYITSLEQDLFKHPSLSSREWVDEYVNYTTDRMTVNLFKFNHPDFNEEDWSYIKEPYDNGGGYYLRWYYRSVSVEWIMDELSYYLMGECVVDNVGNAERELLSDLSQLPSEKKKTFVESVLFLDEIETVEMADMLLEKEDKSMSKNEIKVNHEVNRSNIKEIIENYRNIQGKLNDIHGHYDLQKDTLMNSISDEIKTWRSHEKWFGGVYYDDKVDEIYIQVTYVVHEELLKYLYGLGLRVTIRSDEYSNLRVYVE